MTCVCIHINNTVSQDFNSGCDAGTSSDDDDDVAHASVSGYYDNNNQYCYTITEHVEYPDVRVGSGARGSSSLTRRPLSSHRRHYHPAAALGEDMDMSYEVGYANESFTYSVWVHNYVD